MQPANTLSKHRHQTIKPARSAVLLLLVRVGQLLLIAAAIRQLVLLYCLHVSLVLLCLALALRSLATALALLGWLVSTLGALGCSLGSGLGCCCLALWRRL